MSRPRQKLPRATRRLWGEPLEPRHFLADDLADGLDLLDSLSFSTSDLLASSAADQSPLADYAAAADDGDAMGVMGPEAPSPPPPPRHNPVSPNDVDASGDLTPLDALLVINHLHDGDPSLTTPE